MVATNGHTNGTSPKTEYASPTTIIEGTIERTNERGFRLAGREGWLNLSRYATPAPEVPAVGTQVKVGLDKSGYVRSVEPVTAGAPATNPTSVNAEIAAAAPDRQRLIIRQNVLGHATRFVVAAGGTVDDLLAVAERLEVWVNRTA
jgi:hypothetical protein